MKSPSIPTCKTSCRCCTHNVKYTTQHSSIQYEIEVDHTGPHQQYIHLCCILEQQLLSSPQLQSLVIIISADAEIVVTHSSIGRYVIILYDLTQDVYKRTLSLFLLRLVLHACKQRKGFIFSGFFYFRYSNNDTWPAIIYTLYRAQTYLELLYLSSENDLMKLNYPPSYINGHGWGYFKSKVIREDNCINVILRNSTEELSQL